MRLSMVISRPSAGQQSAGPGFGGVGSGSGRDAGAPAAAKPGSYFFFGPPVSHVKSSIKANMKARLGVDQQFIGGAAQCRRRRLDSLPSLAPAPVMIYAATAAAVARFAIFAIVARLHPVTPCIADHDMPLASMVAMPPLRCVSSGRPL